MLPDGIKLLLPQHPKYLSLFWNENSCSRFMEFRLRWNHVYLPCVLTMYTYHVYLPCVLTMYTYHVYLPCILTMCTYHVYLPCVLTMCTYHVYLPCVLTMYTYHVYLPCILTMCTYHVYLPCVLTPWSRVILENLTGFHLVQKPYMWSVIYIVAFWAFSFFGLPGGGGGVAKTTYHWYKASSMVL